MHILIFFFFLTVSFKISLGSSIIQLKFTCYYTILCFT